MEVWKIIDCIDAVSISPKATITQLRHEEDGEPYQVWRIDTDNTKYILKEAKGMEAEIHQLILAIAQEIVPALYQVINIEETTYLLMEYIEGENLCNCNRAKLTHALDALIYLQRKTWENLPLAQSKDLFENDLLRRQNRGKYLNDSLLEEAYGKFLNVYQCVPKTLCHDDLLPFNILATNQEASYS